MSGVQLLDFTRDQVTARGLVPLRGNARRAFLHGETLFAVSDDQVATFNIDDRDAPARRDALALANVADKTVRVGEHLVELGSDWWTNEPQITVVPIDAGAQGVPVATIELAKAVNPGSDPCYSRYWSAFAGSSQLFVEGSDVYIAYDAGFAGAGGKGRMGFAVLDMTDPAHPALRGSAILEIIRNPPPQTYGYRILRMWRRLLQPIPPAFGRAATVSRRWARPSSCRSSNSDRPARRWLCPYDIRPTRAILHAVDLSDATQIRLTSSTTLGDGASSSGLFVDGSRVFTSHQEDVIERPGRTRFFVDRLDFAKPSAPVRAKFNVPGSLLNVDRGGERLVTVDYRRTLTPAAQSSRTCQAEGGFSMGTWIYKAPHRADQEVAFKSIEL